MDREEDNIVALLYEASLGGCLSTLNTLVQRDALILNKVSLTSFGETPLHIAALLGHLEFTKALLTKKPKLADEVDLSGRSPLHLASAEGHTEIVKALLQANPDVCLVLDQDGRIPLHLAAIRGRVEVVQELIVARPVSVLVNLDKETVLHLCVRYNRLEALKLLLESSTGAELILNTKDHDGNTILHLAVILKQMKVTFDNKILSVPEIKREANYAVNKFGFTALDVLELSPRDFKYLKVQEFLKEAGVRNLNSPLPPRPCAIIALDEPHPAQSIIAEQEQPSQSSTTERQPAQSRFKKWCKYLGSWSWLEVEYLKYQGNWVEETRGTLMLVATVIATMTFQAAVTPPGGVWQENTTTGGSNCANPVCEAGTAVLSYAWTHDFLKFLSFNTISFFAALCVVLLVISGFPLKSKFSIWFLTLTMSTSVTFMALTYIWAVGLVTPNQLQAKVLHRIAYPLVGTWIALLVIVGLINIIRLFSWLVNKLRKPIPKSTMSTPTDDENRPAS